MDDLKILESEHSSGIARLVNEYSMRVGDKKVGIKVYLDSDGYYQMDTSHYYRGEGKAGVYTTSAANFKSEQEALIYANRQLTSLYDGKGEWHKNDEYNL